MEYIMEWCILNELEIINLFALREISYIHIFEINGAKVINSSNDSAQRFL